MLSRGKVIVDAGAYLGSAGDGHFIKRSRNTSSDIRNTRERRRQWTSASSCSAIRPLHGS